MSHTLPRIAVIGTGGTISSLGASSLDVLDYPDFGQKLSAEALLDRFRRDPARRRPGAGHLSPGRQHRYRAEGLARAARMIHEIARDDPAIAGFVIPHGTATLEETGFFLNLTLGVAQPVVLVGAQRPASALGTDAGMNLVNALQVAGSPEARGKGVLVVLNDEIHAGARRGQDLDLSGADLPLARFRRARPCRRRRRAFLPRAVAGAHAGDRVCRSRPRRAIAAGRHRLFLCRRRRRAGRRGGRRRGHAASISAGFAPGSPTPEQRPRSSARPNPGSSSCSAAARLAAGSRRAAGCARPASSPARISARKRPASC